MCAKFEQYASCTICPATACLSMELSSWVAHVVSRSASHRKVWVGLCCWSGLSSICMVGQQEERTV